jgi:hypothetical protein
MWALDVTISHVSSRKGDIAIAAVKWLFSGVCCKRRSGQYLVSRVMRKHYGLTCAAMACQVLISRERAFADITLSTC